MKRSQKFLTTLCLLISVLLNTQLVNAADNTQAEPLNENTIGVQYHPTYPTKEKPSAFIFEVKPGETTEDYLTVINTLNRKNQIVLYPADGYINNQKDFAARLKSEKQENIGQWLKIESPITLEANETKKIKVTVTIPKDTKLGDYRGAIALEKTLSQRGQIVPTLRMLSEVKLKVTNNPKEIQKIIVSETNNNTNMYYFIGTIIVAVICLSYWLMATLKNKKHVKKDN